TGQADTTSRLEKDLNMKAVLAGLAVTVVLMVFVYNIFSQNLSSAVLAAVVMAIAGFFFAAVSGNLVGTIGSSNNPVSGLTLSTLIIAALLMVLVGATGTTGVAAVLGVAAVVCVSSAVAGEMLQDLKVGHILGGTPWKMQVGNVFGILVSSVVLYFPLMLLIGAFELGSRELSAPQAGLMAALAQGIVGGEMAWPLVIVGMFMGFAMILVQVRSPMLVAVGMYLPLETTFAIFCGGMFKGLMDRLAAKRGLNAAQKARAQNVGILLAAGLIAGEGLTALLRALWKFLFLQQVLIKSDVPQVLKGANYFGGVNLYLGGLVVLALIALYLIYVPLRNAGAADEPPPPSAVI
ncbi:MAG: OPT/YSL family transporter, partial [Candidatus Aminicenantes bacterium]|nr:OPT/YSL family transporter [Candidatus Aminicenantes bacterium]